MFVNIGLNPDRVARTDMPPGELLIADGDDDVGRVWQAVDGELRGSAPAQWGRRYCFDLERAPDHVVLRAADAEVGVVLLCHKLHLWLLRTRRTQWGHR
jgi:hypothetical protein